MSDTPFGKSNQGHRTEDDGGAEVLTKPASETQAEPKPKRSEKEAKRLASWAVRRSEREGKIEVRLESPEGDVAHFFMGWLEAYDLSNKLLQKVTEVKAET